MKNIKILIIDDDISVLEAIHESIKSLNDSISPMFETDPQKALSLIKSGFFDLVFCDYIFSGSSITGLEIFQEIKKIYRDNVHVGVLITSWGTTELFTHEQASGLFASFIEKPFSAFDNLKKKISNAISLLQRRAEDRQEADKQEPGT